MDFDVSTSTGLGWEKREEQERYLIFLGSAVGSKRLMLELPNKQFKSMAIIKISAVLLDGHVSSLPVTGQIMSDTSGNTDFRLYDGSNLGFSSPVQGI